ncbi:MAG: hypothetical protein ACJAXU_001892, partial [Paracoccaceae bacterium]
AIFDCTTVFGGAEKQPKTSGIFRGFILKLRKANMLTC